MAIYKSKTVSEFTIIPNEVFKSGMSLEAIGLLAYFLSLPKDWVIYKTTIHGQLNIGREKLDRIFKELQETGYVISVEKRENGKINYEHIVYDKPFNGEPLTEKPYTGFPSTADPLLQSNNIQSTNEQSTKEQKKENIEPFSFAEFWKLYPVKVDKAKCEAKWKKLTDDEKLKIKETLPAFVRYKKFETWNHPHPSTYLNNKRWDDEIPSSDSNNGSAAMTPYQLEAEMYSKYTKEQIDIVHKHFYAQMDLPEWFDKKYAEVANPDRKR